MYVDTTEYEKHWKTADVRIATMGMNPIWSISNRDPKDIAVITVKYHVTHQLTSNCLMYLNRIKGMPMIFDPDETIEGFDFWDRIRLY